MDDDVTRFTAIKGIGKRTDARLHEAGVETWHSLAEVLMALSTIREASSERLGDMGRQAAKRASRTRDGATTEARDVERPHGFVVEITFDPSGGALRSSVTDVRAGQGQQWAGWEPAALISFIEQRTGLDGSPATAPARPAGAVRSRRPTAPRPRPAAKRTKRAERAARPERVGRAERAKRGARPVEPPTSTTVGLGRTIGGRPRTVEVVVELGAPGAAPPSSSGPPVTELDATLGLRALGQTAVQDLARTSAATTEPEAHPRVPQRGHPCWHPQPRGRARGQRTGRRRRPDRPRRPGGVSDVTRRRRREASACARYVDATVLTSWSAGLEGSHNVGNSSSGRNPEASRTLGSSV